jgi:hypothetical protein
MEAASPLVLPFQGLLERVVVEAGDLLVIALVQAHALSVEQIDGGDDVHGAAG